MRGKPGAFRHINAFFVNRDFIYTRLMLIQMHREELIELKVHATLSLAINEEKSQKVMILETDDALYALECLNSKLWQRHHPSFMFNHQIALENSEILACITNTGEERYYDNLAEDRRAFVDLWGPHFLVIAFLGLFFSALQTILSIYQYIMNP